MERFCIFGNSASACESVGNCLKADGADICIFVSKNVNRLASEAKKYLKSERKSVLVMTNRELTSATAIFSKSGIYDLYVCPCDLPANRPVSSAKSSDVILHIDNSKPRLRMLDAEIFSKCNQNCIACTHFSSLTEVEDHVTIEELERDFTKLHDFFWGIERIDLLGGEPLMNTRVNEYIYMTHRIFPDADIHVATNGLLIPTVADKLPKNMNNYNCELSITQYPTTAKIKDVIDDKLKSNHIPYETSKTRRIFFKTLFEQPQEASRRFAYKCCMLKPCNGLFRGHNQPARQRSAFTA